MKRKSMMLSMAIVLLSVSAGAFAQVTRTDTLPTVYITAKSVVAKKVSDAFKQQFKEAVGPRWFRINREYLVKFVSKDQKNHALYHNKGQLVYHISYGDKTGLPKAISDKVTSSYSDGKITTAINVHQDDRNIWVINVETPKLLILIREEDGEITEMERYQKG
ncbi:hypothetical protein [Mucilaginibacter sp.]|uniref:hypothetical protein n=1 Tax=Mucilaginibacter sp. TaxID=1882438 RepID=UPI002BF73C0A|nr:hypothetical protein [Mucilaginibacter sp.]HTI61111.1 hypothetical protein [Mucilaginibacter sp.]